MKRQFAVLLSLILGGWMMSPGAFAQGYPAKAGDILIANYNAGSVVKIDAVTGAQQQLGGTFEVPTDLVMDANGSLYITEWQGRIKRLDLASGTLTTIMDLGSGPSQVWGITQGLNGDLFVTSRANHAVYRVDPSTGAPTLLAQGNFLDTPVGIDMLDSDHLVVACLMVNRLVLVSITDQSQSVILEGGGLDQPWGVAVSGTDIYVGSYDMKHVQRVSSGGALTSVATLAGVPYGMAVDNDGNPVVGAKGAGEEVVRITPAGTILRSYTGPLVRQATGVEVSAINVGAVAGRHAFYNRSAWDGNDPLANINDDNAIASDKAALLPGGVATSANYTSYTRGINGIMVDLHGLAGAPIASDFTFKVGNNNTPGSWTAAPAPSSITVRPGAGANQSDRVTLIWPDQAIKKQWLEVTVNATANTGLSSPDVFYFGNAVAEVADDASTDVLVNDALQILHNLRTPVPIQSALDVDRDGAVLVNDALACLYNLVAGIQALQLIDLSGAPIGVLGASGSLLYVDRLGLAQALLGQDLSDSPRAQASASAVKMRTEAGKTQVLLIERRADGGGLILFAAPAGTPVQAWGTVNIGEPHWKLLPSVRVPAPMGPLVSVEVSAEEFDGSGFFRLE